MFTVCVRWRCTQRSARYDLWCLLAALALGEGDEVTGLDALAPLDGVLHEDVWVGRYGGRR